MSKPKGTVSKAIKEKIEAYFKKQNDIKKKQIVLYTHNDSK